MAYYERCIKYGDESSLIDRRITNPAVRIKLVLASLLHSLTGFEGQLNGRSEFNARHKVEMCKRWTFLK